MRRKGIIVGNRVRCNRRNSLISVVALVVFDYGKNPAQGYVIGNEYRQMFLRRIREDTVPKEEKIPEELPNDEHESIHSEIDGWNVGNASMSDSIDSLLNSHQNVPRSHFELTSAFPIQTENEIGAHVAFSPVENWCLLKLDRWYSASQSLKCPFFRRRFGDTLDVLESAVKHTIIRKECWPMMGPPQAHRPAGTNKKQNKNKQRDLTPHQLRSCVWNDWKVGTGKGYYITGRLNTSIYRDDCLFLGPDPDLPCDGLRKYVGVASHLFDYSSSLATLESLEIVQKNAEGSINDFPSSFQINNDYDAEDQIPERIAIVARWKLRAILRLPWKPSLPMLSGQTIYHVDDNGLIACHEEYWDYSAPRAFCHTFFPKLANQIWPSYEATN